MVRWSASAGSQYGGICAHFQKKKILINAWRKFYEMPSFESQLVLIIKMAELSQTLLENRHSIYED